MRLFLTLIKTVIIVYDPEMVQAILTAVPDDQRLVCVVSHGSAPESSPVSLMAHIAESLPRPPPSQNLTTHAYNVHSPSFVIPGSSTYHPGSAALAHTRSLVFLRKHLGGPQFDIEKVWDEHTYFEFEIRSVAKTMGTMVVSGPSHYISICITRVLLARAVCEPRTHSEI